MPRILLANDDGLWALGLNVLADVLAEIAEVWVVAPDGERSAASHAISLHRPLRLKQHQEKSYTVDGTPADCVYMGLFHVMAKAKPDLVVSGINMGPNLGNDVLYSGTVAAAMEGALFGLPALAISLCVVGPPAPVADEFLPAAKVAKDLVKALLAKPLHPGVMLNVNVPRLPIEKIQGYKLARLGYINWANAVVPRQDPRGKEYFWIGGDRLGTDDIEDSDNNAIANGYIAITPIHYDLTDFRAFEPVRNFEITALPKAIDNLGTGPLAYPKNPHR